jgi:hypothetical protein
VDFSFTIENRNRQGHKKKFNEKDFIVTLSRFGLHPCILTPKFGELPSTKDELKSGGNFGYVYNFSLPPLLNPSIAPSVWSKVDQWKFFDAIQKDVRNQEWEVSILLDGKHVAESPYSSKTARTFNLRGLFLGKVPITLEMSHVIIAMVIADEEIYLLSGTKTDYLITRINLQKHTSCKFGVPCPERYDVPIGIAVLETRTVILFARIRNTRKDQLVLTTCCLVDAKGQLQVQFNPEFPLSSGARIAAEQNKIAIYDKSQIQLFTSDGKFLFRRRLRAEIRWFSETMDEFWNCSSIRKHPFQLQP